MKSKKFFSIFALIISICAILSACAPAALPENKKFCKVVLSDSAYYACAENIKTIPRGSNVDFMLEMVNGYTFDNASYGDCSVDIGLPVGGKRTVRLTLHNVIYSSFVEVNVRPEVFFSVSITPSSAFRCETYEQLVMEGTNAEFMLLFKEDYTFAGIDYQGGYHVTGIDSDVNAKLERQVVLTVENVMQDTEITVTEREAVPPVTEGPLELPSVPGFAVVGYVLNGGWYISGKENGGSYYSINYPLSQHRRPNTSLGTDMISRHGYVLTGWNTHPDGNGLHIGLGSRADVKKGETLALYAEWAEWTDASLFDYVLINTADIPLLYEEKEDKQQKLNELAENANSDDRSAVVTRYRGIFAEKLVIPEILDGYPVAVVAGGMVKNDTKIKTVVFPISVQYVMEYAFIGCEKLTEIYLYDNMTNIDGLAFGERNGTEPQKGEHIETVHINAKEIPIFGRNESAQLANKLEMLMEHEQDAKTVIFGSCSIWYSLNAEDFGRATNRLAFNMGVEGETCNLVQLDLIKRFMHKGDTLIYMCDIGTPYSLGYEHSFDWRTFRMFEFNYDLLAMTNVQRYSNIISSLNEYFITKDFAISTGSLGSYNDYLNYITSYGDMGLMLGTPGHNGIYNFIPKQTLEENRALEKTKELLQGFTDIGIDAYYGFGLVSEVCVENKSGADKIVEELNDYFIERFETLEMPAKMIGNLYSSILPDKYFYDQPYRLNATGRDYYTAKFIEYFLSVV